MSSLCFPYICMKIYIIEIKGYTINSPLDAKYWKPYLKSFSSSCLETTSNPAFAKIWMKKETAEKNAEKAVSYLKGLYRSHPNVTAKVLEVEFTILNP